MEVPTGIFKCVKTTFKEMVRYKTDKICGLFVEIKKTYSSVRETERKL